MDIWVAVVLIAIAVSTAYSAWRQTSFSIIVSAACMFVFMVELIADQITTGGILSEIGFMPTDLTHPAYLYTLLTSMYAHASFQHILWNVIGLVFIGMIFEQRIGVRPFILLYFLSGLVGTLVFAALHWNSAALVVGASGAISGVLGGSARLFPNERISLFFLPPMSVWGIVGIFVLIQILIVLTSSHIAFEAHLGGLAAGILLAPFIKKIPLQDRAKKMIAPPSLRRLATTPELESQLQRIEKEEVPDVKSAWIEHFLSKAKCPHCGSPLKTTKEAIVCEKGHLI
ncbi:MAG: rhomboid family intramembrane serine protease [Thermoplasmatota archaeon]